MKRMCILVADATRARVFTYEQHQEPDGPKEAFRELDDLVDLARRKRPTELFSDSSGGNHTGARGYSFDDHRQAHLDQLDTNFAAELVAAVSRITTEGSYHSLLVVASSRMLGQLRPAFETLRRTVTITEIERDLTKLAEAELRDHLATLDLLPPRPRLAFANR
jgi:protein required for attachment to host cells